MIKNLEIKILKDSGDFKIVETSMGSILVESEVFSREFASIAYYYFLKVKNIKIPDCSYIKISIKNSTETSNISFEINDKVLYISSNQDFSKYQVLTNQKKKIFQYDLLNSILKLTFDHFGICNDILNRILEEINLNGQEMKVELFSKRINKQTTFTIILQMQIDSFEFIGEFDEPNKKVEISILRSIPSYLVLPNLFGGYCINVNQLTIGTKKQEIFLIDFETKSVNIFESEKSLVSKWALSN